MGDRLPVAAKKLQAQPFCVDGVWRAEVELPDGSVGVCHGHTEDELAGKLEAAAASGSE